MRQVVVLVSILSIAALLVPVIPEAQAQSSTGLETGRIRLRQEALRLQQAVIEFERAKGLQKDGLISTSDYQRVQIAVETARLSFELAKAEILGLGRRVSVLRAVKVQQGGTRLVRLTVRATTGPELDGVPPSDQDKGQAEAVLSVRSSGVNVGRPYERTLSIGSTDVEMTLAFELLRDVDDIVVHWEVPGRQEDIPVVMERDSRQISIESERFSQEADLGSDAVFDLRIDAYSATMSPYALAVSGLPQEVHAEFVDPVTKSRLTQLRLGGAARTALLNLRVSLPREGTTIVKADQALSFEVAVLPSAEAKRAESLGLAKFIRAAQESSIAFPGGLARLELLPRGVPHLEFAVQPLFLEGEPGARLSTTVLLKNLGTRRLEGLRARADVPDQWRWKTEPSRIPDVEPGHEERVGLTIDIDAGAEVGEREIRFALDQADDAAKGAAEPRTLRIRVSKPSSWLLISVLALGLLALAVGAVWISMRLGRR